MIAQLGPYFIDEALAEGGMARVFRARLRGPGGFEKQLVLKQIRPELARDPQFVELFVREANLLVSLSHPHIVQVYELGTADGSYYISMEYVEGATVAQMLAHGALSPALTAHLGAQICDALDYAHGRFGILHRDITPRNIIVDEAGHARLLDFGIATTERAAASTWLGSPGYMSPEQVEREALSPASDMFALGCVLYEALCGKPAFERQVRASLEAAPPLKPGDSLPENLTTLVQALLARTPALRPSAKETARVLRAYLAQARPEGVLEEMQERAAHARAQRERRRASSPPHADGAAQTAPVAARSIATSPVLTELLRSAPGVVMPAAEGHTRPVREASTRRSPEGVDGAHTRRVRASAEGHAASDQARARGPLTRRMLRSWPVLAILALGASLALTAQRAQRDGGVARQAPATAAPAQATHESTKRAAQEGTGHAAGASHSAELVVPANVSQGAGASARDSVSPRDAEPGTGLPPGPIGAPPAASGPGSSKRAGAASESVEAERATLSVNAVPWADVKIDGRAHGSTPLRKLKLRPGLHRVSVRCPPLDRSAELVLELPPKSDARIAVDLQQSPVRTFLDGAKEVR